MSLIGALTQAAGKTAKKTAPFYSAVDEALAAVKRPKGTGAEFFTELSKQPGVKKAELADRKLEQAFKAKGKMTKEEAQQVLKDNPPPQIKEKLYDESTAIDEEEIREMVSQEMYGRPYDEIYKTSELRRISDEVYRQMDENLGTKHGKWKTPNGENYREILLKLPSTRPDAKNYTDPAKYDADMKAFNAVGRNDYQSSHWEDDPNVLAHMRVQDRTGPNGEKILHVEEIQSDWHQAGRKGGYRNESAYQEARQKADEVARAAGFNDALHAAEGWKGHGMANAKEASDLYDEASKFASVNAVPDAPFKKNWHELAMKRLLNYAADNGYDSIALTPGAEQAKRFSLSQHVEKIDYFKNPDGTYNFVAYSKQNHPLVHKTDVGFDELGNYVGTEVAQKIADAAGAPRPTNLGIGKIGNNWEIVDAYGETIEKHKTKRDAEASLQQIQSSGGTLKNIDLEVGGEGMKGFYDKMLPDYLNNFGKQYGAKVEMDSVPISTRDPKSTGWDGGQGDHPFMTSQDLSEPFDGMVELLRRNPETGEQELVGRMLRADSEARIASELMKLDKFNQIKLHNFPITPEMRESIKQKGLPLYQQVGIPTAGAGAASQALQPEEESGLAGGGMINSAIKQAHLAKLAKMRQEMAPRAEAVKALIARDENRYLADVVPNSLTNAEIEAEIKRMAAKAPMIMKPSALTELRKIVEQEKGGYGARRLERAADEIPNLEKMYKEKALREAFTGDNAKALMTMNPADFEKFASQLEDRTRHWGNKGASDPDKFNLPTAEYIKYLRTVGPFDDVPFLDINKQEQGLPLIPFISGHEGRHRNRALANQGEKAGLVQLLPRAELREPFPRRSQQEYIDALKEELEMTNNMVDPQVYLSPDVFAIPSQIRRPSIKLPDVYAKGGSIKHQVKKAVGGAINFDTAPDMSDEGRMIQGAPFKRGGKVNMTANRDTMFLELSNKKLKRK